MASPRRVPRAIAAAILIGLCAQSVVAAGGDADDDDAGSSAPAAAVALSTAAGRARAWARAGGLKDRVCDACEDEGVLVINEALNAILNGGMVTACADVCERLSTPRGRTICADACRAVGIAAFVETIKRLGEFIDGTDLARVRAPSSAPVSEC